MKPHTRKSWWGGLLVFTVAVAMVGCDTQGPTQLDDEATFEASLLSEALGSQINLSSVQQQGLRDMMDDQVRRRGEPGHLWYIAAALNDALTDEQKAALFDRAAEIEANAGLFGPGGFDGPEGLRGPGGFMGPGGNGPGGIQGPGLLRLVEQVITEDQQEAFDALKQQFHDDFEALVASAREGTITHEEFFDQMRALHEALDTAIQDLLTDEQEQQLQDLIDQLEADREAHRAEHQQQLEERWAAELEAMTEALGLTDDQVAAIQALHETQVSNREALIEQLRNGDIDQEAFVAALGELKDAELEALAGILSDAQLEVVRIHDALRILHDFQMAHHRRRGPGGGGPGGGMGGPGGGMGGPGGGRG